MASWSELPEDLLALVFARIFSPVHRAYFLAVCHSWRSAARPPARQLPWIVIQNGAFMTPSDRTMHRIVSHPKAMRSCIGMAPADRARHHHFPFPKTMACIGSTDGWIIIEDRVDNMHRNYSLHDMFSGTTLSLPELDAAIGHVSELFKIRKVLLRSTPDDVIALRTNHRSCPIILTRLGKGVWLPRSYAAPLVNIVDVAFLGDGLYGITKDEDLVFLDIALDDNGVPMVNGCNCVIGEGFDYDDHNVDGIEDDDDNDDGDDPHHNHDDDDDNDADPHHDDDDDDDDDDSSDLEDEYENYDDGQDNDGDDDDDSSEYENYDDGQDNYDTDDDLTKMTEEDMVPQEIEYIVVDESMEHDIQTMWYLVESRGKLLMVRRQVVSPFEFTHKVEVFEANMSAAVWVPVTDGLEDQVLFISRRFSKSVSAACISISRETGKDAIYFADADDVFDMRPQSVSAQRGDFDSYNIHLSSAKPERLTWVFPPELVA
ncbi:hypothetical protein VPH35_087992 [Triticum aestivum]|uniref:KIB1-4 beta-propeller domain-containing protein n=1 Tax=Triticum aestivum TaxID=4565 RepID=A0A3B6LFZ5_WHEAT